MSAMTRPATPDTGASVGTLEQLLVPFDLPLQLSNFALREA
jgi:hypothetical protein